MKKWKCKILVHAFPTFYAIRNITRNKNKNNDINHTLYNNNNNNIKKDMEGRKKLYGQIKIFIYL